MDSNTGGRTEVAKIYFPQYARGRDGVNISVGETILAHIRKIGGVEIDSECGGQGVCGKDVVRIERGAESLSELTEIEKGLLAKGKLRSGWRLACQARVTRDLSGISVFMPDFGKYTILTDIVATDTELVPCACRKHGRVLYHTGEDLGPCRERILGLAIDVGTTTLVMQVVDLETGKNVGQPVASKNPQIAYGNDVISRIDYANEHEAGLKELHGAVVDGVNNSLVVLEQQLGMEPGQITGSIYDVVVVGNSTMRSIVFQQNVRDLGLIPFDSLNKNSLTRKAEGLGLSVHAEAMVYGAPLIGGHAGADCLADIIATRLYEKEEIGLIIDIGTNGEVAIGNREKILTASCAAGGAYEGYQIRCGVGAIQGAITQVRIRDGKVEFKTLGDQPPLGLCGSGVIDLLAEMLRNGIMNERARVREDYHLTDDIFLSQDDINQLITAKAGLRADQDLLIHYFGISLDAVRSVYLAGAFGNYMNIPNAIAIGLLPKADPSRFVRFGNGALAGARDMLISRNRRQDAEALAQSITHMKPNEKEGEQFLFMVADRMYF